MKRTTEALFVGGLSLLLVIPFAPIFMWAFSNIWRYPNPWPQKFGIRGWRNFLEFGGFSALINSLMIGVLVSLIVVPLSFLAAGALYKLGKWPAMFFEAILFVPVVLPPFVLVIGVATGAIAFSVPVKLAVILTLSVLAFPYCIFIFRSSFVNYGFGWEEESALLGANNRETFTRVRIPMFYKSILAATLVAFLIGWSDYIVTITIGAGQIISLPLLIGSSASAPGNDSMLAAMSIVSILIPVLITIVFRRLTKAGKLVISK